MVAIVGMAFKFPGGAVTTGSFWRVLEQGRDCVGPMPPGRTALFPKVEDDYPARAGYLEDVAGFDNGFFNINGLELLHQRVTLHALELVFHHFHEIGLVT